MVLALFASPFGDPRGRRAGWANSGSARECASGECARNPRGKTFVKRTTLVKINLKSGGRPRRCRRALQCRYRAPSMSTPGQRWSDRERLGSSMMTDIGGAAPTTTSHSSFLRPMSHHNQFCSCGQFLRLILTRVGRAECLRGQ